MNAVLDSHQSVASCGMNEVLEALPVVVGCGMDLIPDIENKEFVTLRDARNPGGAHFDIGINDWKNFINKVKARTFRRIKSKPGVSCVSKCNIYIVLTYHGWIEFKYNSSTLTYHMSQSRCQEFFEDIRKGKFDLIN